MSNQSSTSATPVNGCRRWCAAKKLTTLASNESSAPARTSTATSTKAAQPREGRDQEQPALPAEAGSAVQQPAQTRLPQRLRQLLEVADHDVAGGVRDVGVVGADEVDGGHAGGLRPGDVRALDVANVGRLRGADSQFLEHVQEHARVRLAHPVLVGEVGVLEVPEQVVAVEQLAQHRPRRVAGVADDGQPVALGELRHGVDGARHGLGRQLEDETLEAVDERAVQLGRQPDAERAEDGVDELAAGRRAVLVRPDGVEVVPAGAQRVGQRQVGGPQSGRAQGVREHGGAQRLPRAAARVHEQGAPEVERDGPQHDPSVPDEIGRESPPAQAGRGAPCETSGRYETVVLCGVRQSSADAPSRATRSGRRRPLDVQEVEVDASARGAHERPRITRHSFRCTEAVATFATLILAAARHRGTPFKKPRLHSYPETVGLYFG